MEMLAGTSGYSDEEWQGPSHPEKLAFDAERLPSVEIDDTFDRLPESDVLATSASQAG
ncbi:MAG: hypothetical protein HKP30_01310 [Myxococcales bacterium]|nr:hypothetical protein [Myxococcales bacterium]